MAQKNSVIPAYRVVVKKDASRAHGFIWEIVHDPDAKVMTKSIRAFKTMEEAYISGAAALERIKRAGVIPL